MTAQKTTTNASPATTGHTLDTFTRAHIACALWSSTDGGKPLDRNFSVSDIAPETLVKIIQDCARFQAENAADIATAQDRREWSGTERAGHDFWLARNGHGAGFFDAYKGDPYPDDAAARLQAAAKAFGSFDLYVGDDRQILA